MPEQELENSEIFADDSQGEVSKGSKETEICNRAQHSSIFWNRCKRGGPRNHPFKNPAMRQGGKASPLTMQKQAMQKQTPSNPTQRTLKWRGQHVWAPVSVEIEVASLRDQLNQNRRSFASIYRLLRIKLKQILD
jgi:hypothetical protein